MEGIKHIWYDSSVISSAEFEDRLQVLQIPYISVSKNNLLVQTDISSHALYDQLNPTIGNKSILIGGFDENDYWGYLNADVWSWIKEH